jgi:hypothetical protein
LLLNFAFEYSITKVQENRKEPGMDGTHKPLVYADYVNMLGENINNIRKKAETLLEEIHII